jgi:microcystin degradation protein MlrC
MKIAIGGFQHETNTFAPSKATFDDFVRGRSWPPLAQGEEIFDRSAGINVPIAGFIERVRKTTHQLVPTAWAGTSPSAHVTQDAFERIAEMILARLRAAGTVDAVYLDLHGAMVAEHMDDGEGELLARVRKVVGPTIPVVASLDLHANVTRRMVEHADAMIAYRTYPHVDMAETGERAAHFLLARLDGLSRPHAALRPLSFLIPLQTQSTMLEPAQSIYARLAGMEGGAIDTLSFTPGFPAADFPECGPAVIAYARSVDSAAGTAEAMRAEIEALESEFDTPVYAPEEGVRRAIAIARNASRPVVLADTQDNPGAGGNSDTTGMLRALVGANAQRAAIGLIVDPAAALAAHAMGEGASLEIGLGGKSKIPADTPFHARFTIDKLSQGRFTCAGPFYRGVRMNLGPCACLRLGGVRIVVASDKPQMADLEMYRFIGIEPAREAILVNKSSVHFRADFAPIAEQILVCKAPGPMLADPSDFPWKNLAPGIRLKPNGRRFAPA